MDLFAHFSCHKKLPVEIEDIRDHIVEASVVQSLVYSGVDMDPAVCQGFLHVYEWTNGTAGAHAEVYHSRSLSESERRLVVCKEMLHLLDNHQEAAQTRGAVGELISELVRPLRLATGQPAFSDHTMVIKALMLLLPRDALDILPPAYVSGYMDADQIAKLAKIPVDYVHFLMTPAWQELVEKII